MWVLDLLPRHFPQIACALQLYAVPRAAASNPADAAFWISSPPGSGSPCLQSNPWGSQDPYYNFSVAGRVPDVKWRRGHCPSLRLLSHPAHTAAAEYVVREVAGEVAGEGAAGVIGAVFFDESDLSYCGFWSQPELGCPALAAADVAAQHGVAMRVLANTTVVRCRADCALFLCVLRSPPEPSQTLNAAGVIPIFSLDNRLAASGNGTAAAPPCALPEDDLIAALGNSTWARFYENWPASYFGEAIDPTWLPLPASCPSTPSLPTAAPNTPDTHAAIIANAALEGEAGVPVLAHVYAGACPDPRPPVPVGPGRLGGDLEYGLAAFLMVQVRRLRRF